MKTDLYNTEIGNYLRELRLKAALSTVEAAKHLIPLTASDLEGFEAGRSSPPARTFQKMLVVYKADLFQTNLKVLEVYARARLI